MPSFEDKPLFHSRKIVKGTTEKAWLDRKDPREKWVTIIPLIGILIGVGVAGFLVWDGLRTVVKHSYCPVIDEDWSKGFDTKVWMKEAEVGGFGNGEFEQTTTSDENAFIQDGMLHLKPTLQDDKLVTSNGSLINLLSDGTCTSAAKSWKDCVGMTNVGNGSIVPPVKSARVSTRLGAKIKYGRIEVTARLPKGDWLWPAIWLLPVNNTYGDWPRSGEIDIIESRGNKPGYMQGGSDMVSSTLHWGPTTSLDAWWRTNVKRAAFHTSYSNGFHTFGMEWTEKYIFTYVDSRLLQVMYINFGQPFWTRGQFPLADRNGTALDNPWNATGQVSTPFDQDFYLIFSLGVGGTNGWFQDGQSGKPWVDSSPTAKLAFWNARAKWFPSWVDKGDFVIKRVRMWQQKGYNGC
ncbi:concanavalin A-like lectin/glucanase [Microthyrium microscopicum]|uniref:Concanavalin A-like lectin/glucanase n=1 Tax=Microthyrium microscopicum TaxID=703497 RepID=A0A6A6U9K4_9PEZI|nr:concanavalin A-like lectin/glucanase [Microthyrium microscopicum]